MEHGMGGGGAKSASGRNGGAATTATVNSPMDAQNFQQLAEYMQNKHGITIGTSVQQLDFETVRAGCDGVEAVLNEFPQAADAVSRITYDADTSAYAYARPEYDSATGTYKTTIAMSRFYNDPDRLAASLQRDGRYHPPNSDARQVLAHETGHAMEMALIGRNPSNESRYDMLVSWNGGKESQRIVRSAINEYKRTPEGRGKRTVDILREVSGYAASDKRGRGRSEALAECVGDYMTNGSNAHPLSQIVARRLRAEIG